MKTKEINGKVLEEREAIEAGITIDNCLPSGGNMGRRMEVKVFTQQISRNTEQGNGNR